QTEALAKAARPAASDPVADLLAAPEARGGAFSEAANALVSAVRAVPGTSLDRLGWTDGRLTARLRHPRGVTPDALRPMLEANGYTLTASASALSDDGMISDLEVTR
ncbi:MAG: hypothetical protein AAGD40_04315, partial [Pseudomonadota bacterium]